MPQSAGRRPYTPEQTVPGALNQETIIYSLIGRTFTHTVVMVESVEPGGSGPVGFVNVKNLVMELNADNEGIPNATLYKLPYFRLQGGANAVIIDPKPGDIGLASFAMRDITNVKKNKQEGPPPSRREYDPSDGLYIGGFLNGAPTQYIQFLESGINIVSTGKITATTPGEYEINAAKLRVNAPIEATGDITDTVGGSGQSMAGMRQTYNSHTHPGDSGGTTGTPNQEM